MADIPRLVNDGLPPGVVADNELGGQESLAKLAASPRPNAY